MLDYTVCSHLYHRGWIVTSDHPVTPKDFISLATEILLQSVLVRCFLVIRWLLSGSQRHIP